MICVWRCCLAEIFVLWGSGLGVSITSHTYAFAALVALTFEFDEERFSRVISVWSCGSLGIDLLLDVISYVSRSLTGNPGVSRAKGNYSERSSDDGGQERKRNPK